MLSYYARSSVYLMTSMSEGMPRTLLESMACDQPEVCTDITQLVPIIKAGGIVIQKRDAEGVVAALEQINMNSGEVEGWKERGRKMIEDRYSLNEMNRETEVTYVMSAYE